MWSVLRKKEVKKEKEAKRKKEKGERGGECRNNEGSENTVEL